MGRRPAFDASAIALGLCALAVAAMLAVTAYLPETV